jgi:hypothetical protein
VPTPSILQVPGAKDVAIEFTSMSKTYSMAGWRIGFAVGNPTLIAALTRVKSYLDYGAFTPIQAAAVAAINGPQDIVEENRNLYRRRRDVLVESFGRAGWEIPVPRASMFCWAPLPPALREMGSLEFLQAAPHSGRRRGRAGRRLRRGRRGLRAHRHGGERAAPAPGRAQHPPLPAIHGREHAGHARRGLMAMRFALLALAGALAACATPQRPPVPQPVRPAPPAQPAPEAPKPTPWVPRAAVADGAPVPAAVGT